MSCIVNVRLITLKAKQLMFSNMINNLPQVVNDWLASIYDNAKREELILKRINRHGFRHTGYSLIFEVGATINVVQKRLDIKT
ncbi:site-specific integrase [Marinilactibacillus psychrotolerans]|uniref:hypothetical protein n=1 Tax=Marinilactibacillus psychrotolerans TaxID=191770 RepID=UPI00388D71E9